MGVVESRQGAGTFITTGPPRLGAGPLSFLAALHGFTREQIFEARKVLEVGAAGLAAERGLAGLLAPMAEEVTGMFANLTEPQIFLIHDVRFHRAVAAAAANPVLSSIVEMVSSLVYEQRRVTVERALDLKESAEMHRRIYQAIRDHDPERAAISGELQARVRAAIGELPHKLRLVVVLRDLHGLSYEEIAQVVGCPIGTVRSRLHYATHRLETVLRPYVEVA